MLSTRLKPLSCGFRLKPHTGRLRSSILVYAVSSHKRSVALSCCSLLRAFSKQISRLQMNISWIRPIVLYKILNGSCYIIIMRNYDVFWKCVVFWNIALICICHFRQIERVVFIFYFSFTTAHNILQNCTILTNRI